FDGQPLSAYRAKRPHIAGALLEPTWYMPGHSARAHIRSIAQAAGVIGKGSLIGEYTMDEFLRSGAQPTIRMRVADPDSFVDATSRLEGINLTRRPDGSLEFASEAPDLDRRLGEL
ncbi:ABC transporter ATP-binding protein, partial [Kytococcus schroeteri]